MRVLVLSQYFPPEIGATQTRVHTFASGLAARGHEVQVVCEVPNHPQGIVHPGFRRRAVRRRELDGFEAIHLWVATSRRKTTLRRVLFYGSYMAGAALAGSLLRRPDVIFASSPPLPVGVAAAAAASRHRVPWVLDVRDLWPEAAVAMGELTDPRLLSLAERLERGLYDSAAAITAVTEPFCDSIRAKLSRPDKVTLLPNGTTRFWGEGADLEVDKASMGLPDDRFVWTFAGNVGLAQGLETAIAAAGRLGNGFCLLIVGDGPQREGLEAAAGCLPEGRVRFVSQVPPEEALRYLRASDALLVSLADDPALRSFVPSKLFDFCAVGRPVVLSADGEPQRLVADAALTAPAGDAGALAEAVSRLESDAELRRELARRGRRFGGLNLRETQVERLEALLQAAAANRR